MIAVVGRLAGGTAVDIARCAAAAGGPTELVAAIPAGSDGDRRLLELRAAGVGHAAAPRSPSASLEPADLELALRYLPDVRVIILASDAATLATTAVAAAAWSGAALILVTGGAVDGAVGGDDLPEAPSTIVLAGPATDPDGAFAGLVAALAVRLDAGDDPSGAWRRVTADLGVDAVSRSVAPGPGRPG